MSTKTLELLELELVHAPGFSDSFAITTGGASEVLIVGPNESGKSSLARALFSVLWPGLETNPSLEIVAKFRLGERSLRARHRGLATTWYDEGSEVPAPALPADEIAGCFRIAVDERKGEGVGTATLAAQISRALAGGYDFAKARAALAVAPQLGHVEKDLVKTARRALDEVKSNQGDWEKEAARLDTLREELEQAQRAVAEESALNSFDLERHALRELERIEPELAAVAASEPLTPAFLGHLAAETKRLELSRKACRSREAAVEAARAQLSRSGESARVCDTAATSARLEDARSLLALEGEQQRAQLDVQTLEARLARWMQQAGDADQALPPVELLERFEQFNDDWNAAQGQARALKDLRAFLPADSDRTSAVVTLPGKWTRARIALLVVSLVSLAFGVGAALLVHPLFAALAATALAGAWISLAGPAPLPTTAPAASMQVLLDGQARELEVRLAGLREKAQEFKARFGLQPGLPSAVSLEGLRQRAGDLAQLGDARARLSCAEAAYDDSRDRLASFLEGLGLPPRETAAGLIRQLEQLLAEQQQRSKLQEDFERQTLELAAARLEAADLEKTVEKLFADIGLRVDDAAGLERLTRGRKDFERLSDERKIQRHALESARRDLASWAGWRPNSHSDLDARRSNLLAMKARATEFHREISGIERGVADRRGKEDLENARANLRGAEDALHQRREQAFDAALAQLLIEDVERGMEASLQDAVLLRAQALFEQFTGGRHTLQLSSGAQGVDFRSHDRVLDRELPLESLSSGTRTQMLLAARLAFAVDAAERAGVRPPLVLDEALATTDEARFEAIQGAIATLVSEGWQVLYLTSQRVDLERWRERSLGEDAPKPCVIDLAQVRRLGLAVSDARDFILPAERALPAPGKLSAEEYACALTVPALDLERPLGELHVFHLLRDQLDLVHELAMLHVTQLALAESFASATHREPLTQRIALMRAFHEHWRIGRGRPVDLTLLAEAGVSENFRGRVADLARSKGGDAQLLIAALREGELHGFGRKKTDELEVELQALRCLDLRPRLELGDIVWRCAEQVPGCSAELAGSLCSLWWQAADQSWKKRRGEIAASLPTIPATLLATPR
ncbi:MAG TPA: hypothetical protein VK843_15445 [Planctomycetota bacterium]|nr:hypothetical protein [Planctomycetota bacterium]